MDRRTVGGTKIRPAWFVIAAMAVLALIAAGVRLASLLSFGILLLCPLLMLGMHRGHGREHGHGADDHTGGHVASDPGAPPTSKRGSTGEGEGGT